MPKLSKFRRALRLAEKAHKHFWLHSPASAHILKENKDDAREFRMETKILIKKRGKIYRRNMHKNIDKIKHTKI